MITKDEIIALLKDIDYFIKYTIQKQRPVFVTVLREEMKINYPYEAIRELAMSEKNVGEKDEDANGTDDTEKPLYDTETLEDDTENNINDAESSSVDVGEMSEKNVGEKLTHIAAKT